VRNAGLYIFILILVFLAFAYYVGAKSTISATGTSLTNLVKQLQGGGANYPKGG